MVLLTFWERLQHIKKLTFQARSLKGQWERNGKGEVFVQKEKNNNLIFYEKGFWLDEGDNNVNFTNTFRWTLELSKNLISLEHLRRGMKKPVFLLHLSL